jgi:RNA polymerase sigma factor (sigma-70 family)
MVPTCLEARLNECNGDARDWPLAVAGDPNAFERVFDRHADLVYRFVQRRTGDKTLAEDTTSEVFLEAWRQRGRVQLVNDSLRSWLLGVASNLIRRHWRNATRRHAATVRIPVPAAEPDHAESVSERLDDQQRLIDLRARLGAMSRKNLDVLLLWAWEELTYEEISNILHVPVGTVRSRLSRARAQLEGDLDARPPGRTRHPEAPTNTSVTDFVWRKQ